VVIELYRNTPDPGEGAKMIGDAIKAMNKPALVIWGMKDPFISGEFADRQRDFFDVKEVVKLPESGHWVFQDDPDAVREAIVPFVRTQLQQSPALG
jgi:pimeloyl-ACP methyl ester carboxylesterase